MTDVTPDQYHFTGYLTFDEYLESRRAVASRVGSWANAVVLLNGAAMLVWGALLPDGTDRITAVLVGAAMVFCAVVALPGLVALLARRGATGPGFRGSSGSVASAMDASAANRRA